MKGTGEIGCLLTDHRIHHQQHFIGLHSRTNPHHLIHHLCIDLETPRCIDQNGVKTFRTGLGQSGSSNGLWPGLFTKTEHIHLDLSTKGVQLIDGSRPIHIRRNHQRPATLILEMQSQLGGGGGFTSTL